MDVKQMTTLPEGLVAERMTKDTLALTLAVQDELVQRAEEAQCLRHLQVERAQYEADLAQRRYLKVDPDNRLVASVLEAEWNTTDLDRGK